MPSNGRVDAVATFKIALQSLKDSSQEVNVFVDLVKAFDSMHREDVDMVKAFDLIRS